MIYRFGEYELDVAQVELRRGEQSLALEPQVFAVLCLLVENHERMVSRDEIVEKVWDGRVVSDSAIASRIKALRRALGDDGVTQRFIRTVRGRGFRFVAQVGTPGARQRFAAPDEPDRQHPVNPGGESVPAVAVLPFQWLSDAHEHSIVADALPHELITALSRLRWLAVIARGSSFRFRTPDLDLREVGRSLGAAYCVCGVVEGRGKQLTVAAELSDCRSGRVIWGERFHGSADYIHEVREQIVSSIVAALEIHIPLHEAHLARLAPPESLDAWANYHLGLQAMYRFNRRDNDAAERYFRRAVELDPEFARAHAGLSFTSFQDAFLRYKDDTGAATDLARRHAERSVELDPYDAFANFVMGRSYWLTGDIETSLNWLDRTIAFSPNFAQGLYSRGWADAVAGRGRDARVHVDKAMRLSPLDPLLYGMMGTRALSHIAQAEFDDAVPWAEKAANAPGAHVLIGVIAVIAHALAGDDRRAAIWSANVKRRRPDVSREHFFRSFPFGNADTKRAVAAVLSHHGF